MDAITYYTDVGMKTNHEHCKCIHGRSITLLKTDEAPDPPSGSIVVGLLSPEEAKWKDENQIPHYPDFESTPAHAKVAEADAAELDPATPDHPASLPPKLEGKEIEDSRGGETTSHSTDTKNLESTEDHKEVPKTPSLSEDQFIKDVLRSLSGKGNFNYAKLPSRTSAYMTDASDEVKELVLEVISLPVSCDDADLTPAPRHVIRSSLMQADIVAPQSLERVVLCPGCCVTSVWTAQEVGSSHQSSEYRKCSLCQHDIKRPTSLSAVKRKAGGAVISVTPGSIEGCTKEVVDALKAGVEARSLGLRDVYVYMIAHLNPTDYSFSRRNYDGPDIRQDYLSVDSDDYDLLSMLITHIVACKTDEEFVSSSLKLHDGTLTMLELFRDHATAKGVWRAFRETFWDKHDGDSKRRKVLPSLVNEEYHLVVCTTKDTSHLMTKALWYDYSKRLLDWRDPFNGRPFADTATTSSCGTISVRYEVTTKRRQDPKFLDPRGIAGAIPALVSFFGQDDFEALNDIAYWPSDFHVMDATTSDVPNFRLANVMQTKHSIADVHSCLQKIYTQGAGLREILEDLPRLRTTCLPPGHHDAPFNELIGMAFSMLVRGQEFTPQDEWRALHASIVRCMVHTNELFKVKASDMMTSDDGKSRFTFSQTENLSEGRAGELVETFFTLGKVLFCKVAVKIQCEEGVALRHLYTELLLLSQAAEPGAASVLGLFEHLFHYWRLLLYVMTAQVYSVSVRDLTWGGDTHATKRMTPASFFNNLSHVTSQLQLQVPMLVQPNRYVPSGLGVHGGTAIVDIKPIDLLTTLGVYRFTNATRAAMLPDRPEQPSFGELFQELGLTVVAWTPRAFLNPHMNHIFERNTNDYFEQKNVDFTMAYVKVGQFGLTAMNPGVYNVTQVNNTIGEMSPTHTRVSAIDLPCDDVNAAAGLTVTKLRLLKTGQEYIAYRSILLMVVEALDDESKNNFTVDVLIKRVRQLMDPLIASIKTPLDLNRMVALHECLLMAKSRTDDDWGSTSRKRLMDAFDLLPQFATDAPIVTAPSLVIKGLVRARMGLIRYVLQRPDSPILWNIGSVTLVCGQSSVESLAPQAPMDVDDSGHVRASVIGAGGLRIQTRPKLCVTLGLSTNFSIENHNKKLDEIKLHTLMGSVPPELCQSVRVSAFRVMSTIMLSSNRKVEEHQAPGPSVNDVVNSLNGTTWAVVIPEVLISTDVSVKNHSLSCVVHERSQENTTDIHLERSMRTTMTVPIFNSDPSIRYAKFHPSVTLSTLITDADKSVLSLPLAQSMVGIRCENKQESDILFSEIENQESFNPTTRNHYSMSMSSTTSLGMTAISGREVNEVVTKQLLPLATPQVVSYAQAVVSRTFTVHSSFSDNIAT
uniref:Uncharacterized protein n=1 Tax=viral metagenome TaxID=1070528 RepID=A0A2V0RKU7_9ZZZZ